MKAPLDGPEPISDERLAELRARAGSGWMTSTKDSVALIARLDAAESRLAALPAPPGDTREPICALCGKQAAGYATVTVGDKTIRLCHDDGDAPMTCYHRWTVYGERPAAATPGDLVGAVIEAARKFNESCWEGGGGDRDYNDADKWDLERALAAYDAALASAERPGGEEA